MPRYDRSQIRKGMYLTGGVCPGDRQKLPKDLEHFEATVAAAGPAYGPVFERQQASIQELTQRLRQVRQDLERYSKKPRQ